MKFLKKLLKTSALDLQSAEKDEKQGEKIAEFDLPGIGGVKAKREQIFDIGGEKVTAPVWSFEKFEERGE